MINRLLFVFWVCLLVMSSQAASAAILDTLKPEHPRLLAHDTDFERIARLVKTDALAKGWYAELKEEGEAMLVAPVAKYDIPDGRRLLDVSRSVADRVLTLGLLDRLSPDDRYRDRIWADLDAAAGFKDWNPDHFLDVAEMAFAFGIAYDWLYERWSDEQRMVIRGAIVQHAIRPALLAYERNDWWTRTRINWNQVCNGGLIVASLAIAEDEPAMVETLLKNALASLPLSMQRYAPDGGYEEGPGYWSFGTIYNVFAIASIESALGKDFGLGAMPGFDKTANFPLHMTGPTGDCYNFGDNKEKPVHSPAMFYLTKRYNLPGNAYYAAQHAKGSVLDLIWYDPSVIAGDEPELPLSAVYASAGVATFRSGWSKPTDRYVAAKGGWLGFGHAQMDLGSFIYEDHGVRWFIDLGSDDYNLPGYFSSQDGGGRWNFYRNRAEGHNTLVINPDRTGGQRYDAKAPITCENKEIQIDLSQVYGGSIQRTIRDTGTDAIMIQDAIALDEPGEVWWFSHTRARVELSDDGRTAVLRQDGKQLRVTLSSPVDAKFTVMDAVPLDSSPTPQGQNPNNGTKLLNPAEGVSRVKRGEVPIFGNPDPTQAVRKLAIHFKSVKDVKIEVLCEPVTR